MAGASVPFMANGSAPARLGLGSGRGMSVTTCGAGDGGRGNEGGARSEGAFGLRSGRGRLSASATTGLRSGRGRVPVTVVASDAGVGAAAASGEASGTG